MTKSTHIYQIKPIKTNLSSHIYQTKPLKLSLLNQTNETNSTKPNLQNQTKPTKPNLTLIRRGRGGVQMAHRVLKALFLWNQKSD